MVLCYWYVGGSFCCKFAVSTNEGDSFCSKYVGDNFCCNYAAGKFLFQLYGWYFLQCIMHMTVSIVIVRVILSFIVIQVTVSSYNFIFLSLTDSLFLLRHYIRFIFHHFCKHSSKTKIL